MYFENGVISARQLARMIIVEFIGITILTATGLAGTLCGRDGLIVIVYATVFSLLYILIILMICEKVNGDFFECIKRKFGEGVAKTVEVIFGIKYLVAMSILFVIVAVLIKKILLQHTNIIWIIIPMALLVVYGMRLKMEARGRMCEVAFYFALIPAVITGCITWQKCNRYQLTPLFLTEHSRIILTALLLVALIVPGEMLLFSCNHFKVTNELKRKVTGSVLVLGIINVAYFVLNVGIYGIDKAAGEELSSISLMQTIGHMESLIVLFAVVSLYALIEGYGAYSSFLFNKALKKHEKANVNKAGNVVVTFVAFAIACASVVYGYPFAVENEATANVGIEQKAFIMVMGIDRDDSGYEVTVGMSHKNDDETMTTWTGKNIYSMKEEVGYQMKRTPDFSHIKVIVLGEGIMKDGQTLDEISGFLQDEETVAKDTIMVSSGSDAKELLSLDKKMKTTIGAYIYDMVQNNIPEYHTCVAGFARSMENAGSALTLARIDYDDGKIFYDGDDIINGRGIACKFDLNKAKIIKTTSGRMEGQTLEIKDKKKIQILSDATDISLRVINDETVGVNVVLSGMVKALDTGVKEEQVNEYIKQQVSDILADLLNGSGMDYLQVFDRLSVKDRVMWARYQSNPARLYSRIYFNVQCDYKLGR